VTQLFLNLLFHYQAIFHQWYFFAPGYFVKRRAQYSVSSLLQVNILVLKKQVSQEVLIL